MTPIFRVGKDLRDGTEKAQGTRLACVAGHVLFRGLFRERLMTIDKCGTRQHLLLRIIPSPVPPPAGRLKDRRSDVRLTGRTFGCLRRGERRMGMVLAFFDRTLLFHRRSPMIVAYTHSAIISLLAGILILIMPRLLNYIVALYLIITGLLALIR